MPAPTDPTLLMVRTAVRWSLASLVVTVPGAMLWHGPAAALSAAGGSLVVTAFFALGVLGVNHITSAAPSLSVVGAYVVYCTQLMLLLLVAVVARDVLDIDRPAFALGAVVGTMVWQIAHTRAFSRARISVYTPAAPKEEP